MHEIDFYFFFIFWLLRSGRGNPALPTAVAVNLLILAVTFESERWQIRGETNTKIDSKNQLAPGYITP